MARLPTAETSRCMQRRLLAWFDRNRRSLPWRIDKNPYRVWISEIMLQQTQVAAVIPYYKRFLRRFPTIRDLAKARLEDVLRHWAGLGYYSRARHLHEAARQIVKQHGGEMPRSAETLRSLPGVGRYTAGAIASIAFGQREAIVDGNVSRVLTRLFDVSEDVSQAVGRSKVWRLAELLLPRDRCGDYNEALMELGATICLAGKSARCDECPLRAGCLARANKTVPLRPVKSNKTRIQRETHVVLAVRRDNRWLCRKRPADGLWGGLWEFPTAVLNGKSPRASAMSLADELLDGRATLPRRSAFRFERQLTHRRIDFVGFVGNVPSASATAKDKRLKWMTLSELSRQGISGAVREAASHLADRRDGKSQRVR